MDPGHDRARLGVAGAGDEEPRVGARGVGVVRIRGVEPGERRLGRVEIAAALRDPRDHELRLDRIRAGRLGGAGERDRLVDRARGGRGAGGEEPGARPAPR